MPWAARRACTRPDTPANRAMTPATTPSCSSALVGVPDRQRSARYRCVAAFFDPGTGRSFTAAGACEGHDPGSAARRRAASGTTRCSWCPRWARPWPRSTWRRRTGSPIAPPPSAPWPKPSPVCCGRARRHPARGASQSAHRLRPPDIAICRLPFAPDRRDVGQSRRGLASRAAVSEGPGGRAGGGRAGDRRARIASRW